MLTLAGCADEKVPKEPPRTPTPTIAEPTMPAQAMEDSPEGATSFVRYFVGLINFAATTGDIARLVAITKDCAECAAFVESLPLIRVDGQRVPGDLWTFQTIVWENSTATRGVADITANYSDVDRNLRLALEITESPPYAVTNMFRPEK